MRSISTYVEVCNACGRDFTPGTQHSCVEQSLREAAVKLDVLIQHCEDGVGLLWLYRVAYRVRSRINGLEKYKDRADMARRACYLAAKKRRNDRETEKLRKLETARRQHA